MRDDVDILHRSIEVREDEGTSVSGNLRTVAAALLSLLLAKSKSSFSSIKSKKFAGLRVHFQYIFCAAVKMCISPLGAGFPSANTLPLS